MSTALSRFGFILGFLLVVAGTGWVFQLILFLDRKGPFHYGWKGILGALLWLAFAATVLITLLEPQ